jgi:hypothetical protein
VWGGRRGSSKKNPNTPTKRFIVNGFLGDKNIYNHYFVWGFWFILFFYWARHPPPFQTKTTPL